MKQFPIGIQTFAKIVHDDLLYIDKTQHIYNLIKSGSVYFLSRPRRFGKSLLISTLAALFAGKSKLFEGLWVKENSDCDFEQFPIIHLDLSLRSVANKADLEEFFASSINDIAKNYQVTLSHKPAQARFAELIQKLATINQVVVLIDEYDKPILDNLTKPQVSEIREVLKGFYTILKASDKYLDGVPHLPW